jgi:pimeloyl-ACP methyl ester carboxylesterase
VHRFSRSHLVPFVFVVSAAVALVATGCGSDGDATAASSSSTSSTVAPLTGDATVAVTGGKLHIRCSGAGDQTVVFLPGYGSTLDPFEKVQEELSDTTRVCAYERFGNGSSTPPTGPQTFQGQADALHELLRAVHATTPYVLVGHSLGGPEAVTFASTYLEETAALLLLDGTPPNWLDAQCAVQDGGSAGEAMWHQACESFGDPANNPEQLDGRSAYPQLRTLEKLGDLPVVALSAENGDHAATGLSPAAVAVLERQWAEGQELYAAMSTNSRLDSLPSSHHIHLDHPELVVQIIEGLIDGRTS